MMAKKSNTYSPLNLQHEPGATTTTVDLPYAIFDILSMVLLKQNKIGLGKTHNKPIHSIH